MRGVETEGSRGMNGMLEVWLNNGGTILDE